MFYPQEIISEVKSLNDIVDVVGSYVKLSSRSGNFFGLCPFHNEKTPSFSVNRDKQIFYCFGCGAGGNVISFIKKIENMDFPDALKLLAERVHFNLPQKGSGEQERQRAAAREIAAKTNKLAARFFYENLTDKDAENAKTARKYLEERGITPSLAKRFGLGLSPDAWDGLLKNFPDLPVEDFEKSGLVKKSEKNEARHYDRFRNRLMFPIIDNRNRVIGFGGRVMGDSDEAKYINSPETALFHKSECLYGLNLAKKAHEGQIIIVEGYMDVIAMHLHGFANTVGVLGTALTTSHSRLLKNAGCNTVILILDSDEAGIRAAQRAIPVLIKENLKIKILNLPDAKDPDEYLSRFGAKNFAKTLSQAQSHIAFQIDLIRKKNNLESMEGRVAFTQECAKILAALPSEIEMDAYATEISKATEISHSAIFKEIEKIRGVTSGYSPEPRTYILKKRGEDIGLKNAIKGLLNLVLSDSSAANALKKSECLSSEEIGGGIFGKLLVLAFKNTVNTPSDVFDLFDSDEEHQTIAEIFSDTKDYPSKDARQKALNDMAKKIKLSWLKSRIETERNDTNAVNSLHFQIKTINSLNISMHDG
ncbi:MAG: DNA primase [Clostridiales bacterium]|jgi:DNA primase|nr:DNA primase [Clostridiales bacterium]